MILGSKPYSIKRKNSTLLAGEAVILMIADLLLISTDPSVSVGNRLALGWLNIVILSLSIIASSGSAVLDSLKESKLKC